MTLDLSPQGVALVDQRLASGYNLPAQCYISQTWFDIEMDAVFVDSWQYFGPVHKVEQPGAVLVGDVGRTPIVVVRGKDGKLRGFVNACRHRGFTVVAESGRCARMQCRYHGWIYDLDGTLAQAGRAGGDPLVVKNHIGLWPVSVDTFAQGVFVNPRPDAGSMLAAFPGLEQVADEIGIDHDLQRYRPYATYSVEQASDWKLWYDNGTECYHCPLVHGQSFAAAYDTTDGVYDFVTHTTFSHSHFEPSARPAGLTGGGYRSVQLFPGTQFIQQDDLMVAGRVIPTGPGTCRFEADFYAEDGADPDRVDEWIKLWTQTYDEDASIVESIQRNLASGRVEELIYLEQIEHVSRFFHRLIWDRCRGRIVDGDTWK